MVLYLVNREIGKAARYDEHFRHGVHMGRNGIIGHPADKKPFRALFVK
jgi:hypothetical protein